MAQKFALIPHETYQRLANRTLQPDNGPLSCPINENKPDIHIYGHQPEENADFLELAELMPKNLRAKAKLLMHYLQGAIQLDAQSRVVFQTETADGTSEEQIGSHILDLIKYFVSPSITFGHEAAALRPIDAPKFAQLLSSIGIPQTALGKGKRIDLIASMDKPLIMSSRKKRKAPIRRRSRPIYRKRNRR